VHRPPHLPSRPINPSTRTSFQGTSTRTSFQGTSTLPRFRACEQVLARNFSQADSPATFPPPQPHAPPPENIKLVTRASTLMPWSCSDLKVWGPFSTRSHASTPPWRKSMFCHRNLTAPDRTLPLPGHQGPRQRPVKVKTLVPGSRRCHFSYDM
jgi:hypothetical protein